MTINRLLATLDAAGVELDTHTILDAFWLARFQPDLPSRRGVTFPSPPFEPPPVNLPTPKKPADVPPPPENDSPDFVARNPRESSLNNTRMRDTYAVGVTGKGPRRASPIAIGAAPPLADRLGLSRAIKPLQRRWHSAHEKELDEEATAERTADARLTRPHALIPVLKPRRERWFEVDLVLEDDASVLMWSDTLSAFAQTLRDGGAFRQVRRWRLVLDGKASGSGRQTLEAPSGIRLPATILNGGERRIVLFATHGSSRHWHNGLYDELLAGWARFSALALLPLLPERSWTRTPLGGPSGVCSTNHPGVASMLLDAHPDPWGDIQEDERCYAIPLVEMTKTAVSKWAAMLMNRGRPVPARLRRYPLGPVAEEAWQPIKQEFADNSVIELRVRMLRERSPAAFELAVLLSPTTFTVPVARLIQEAHFGAVDQDALTELFVSGLLTSVATREQGALSANYCIHPRAAEFLIRSLRGRDATSIADELVERVTDHIRERSGTMLSQTVFTPDANGEFALPDSVRPFAAVAEQLRTMVAASQPPPSPVDVRLGSLTARARRRLHALSRNGMAIAQTDVEPETWSLLQADDIALARDDGKRVLHGSAFDLVEELLSKQPLSGTRLLWVDDRPGNNKQLAHLFRSVGVDVIEVPNTAAGLAIIGDQFDLVISDMGRKEGPREGFALIEALRSRGNEIPILIFASGYARSANNRNDAIIAGAQLCTNDSQELYDTALRILRQAEPLGLEVLRQRAKIGATENYALIVTVDRPDSRLNARSGEAFAIAMENCLGLRSENIRRVTLEDMPSSPYTLDDLFPSINGKSPPAGTAFIYVGGIVGKTGAHSIVSLSGNIRTAGEPLELALALRSSGRFSQVMIVLDHGHEPVPAVRELNIEPLLAGIELAERSPLLLIATVTAPPAFNRTRAQDADVLPMTRALIRLIELSPSGELDGRELASAVSKGLRPSPLTQTDGSFVLHKTEYDGAPTLRPWFNYMQEGVDFANKRTRGSDAMALRSYERTLALRPDALDREMHARLVIYRAAIIKRLGRLDKAKTEIFQTTDIWSGTQAEADAWYNIASICAQLGEREETLDAIFAMRDEGAIKRVRGHLKDYFFAYAKDPAFIALTAETKAKRNLEDIAEGQFCTADEIIDIAGRHKDLSRNERPRDRLKFFSTERQQSWLVATARSLLILVDDYRTRSRVGLVQQVLPITAVGAIEARINDRGTVVAVGEHDARTWWHYSDHLFRTPFEIETAIKALIASSISQSKHSAG
ncbi:response regulator [Rhizobium ruizarguesonis]|uniref:response regulator n=1 Tax=Rhizobium ruizarguesonis TaxID=2081791 RepID=UPI0010313F73|nr:response regulator [Rhizobium ruizarguesonis]TAV19054.1 response regulator [Rhizobium ruizarguesonis]